MEEKIKKLAQNLLQNSVDLQPGEKLYIDNRSTSSLPLVEALIETACQIGGVPLYIMEDVRLQRARINNSIAKQIAIYAELQKQLMSQMDAYIGIRDFTNPLDESLIKEEQNRLYQKIYTQQVHFDVRLRQTKWCLLRYPGDVIAYRAGMSTQAFTDFYFQTCLVDYKKMKKAMQPLAKQMSETDKVKIVGPGTNLTFSIKNIPVTCCYGERNVPDGEVYTAPVLGTMNGTIQFNTQTIHNGKQFSNICLTFKDGKVVCANSQGSQEELHKILNIDAGAKIIGEFSFGVNPYITKAIGDTLFDEKIGGSIHLALGNSLEKSDNGNRSAIHWDLVLIQTPDYGGGQIFFDDKLIRKDGLFIPQELQVLNPENLF